MSRAGMRVFGACALLLASTPAHGAPEEPPAWGTASPTIVEYVSPTADVMVLCQAREDTDGDGRVDVVIGQHGEPTGDRVRPYLCLGPGPGEEIDEFVAGSPTGRHVVVLQGGRLLLIEAATRTRVDLTALGADARDHGVPVWPHRAATFDARGRRMAWIRTGEQAHATIQVRDLASGVEAIVELGGVLPVAVWFDTGGAWLWMHAVVEDGDEDGALGFPVLRTSLDDRPCRGSPISYSTGPWRGDAFVRYAAPAGGGTARDTKGARDALGPMLLRRGPDGAFLTEDTAGKERVAVTAESASHLVGIWGGGGVAVLEDTAGPHPGRYRVLRTGGTSHLDLWSAKPPKPRRESEAAPDFERHWRITSRDGGRLVDLDSGVVRAFEPGVIAQHGSRLLLQAAWALSVLDLRTNVRTALDVALDDPPDHRPPLRQAGAVVLHRGYVIDLDAARCLGTCPEHALAVASDGRVLLPPDPKFRGLVQGPLRWTTPTPRPTPGAPGAGK